MRCKGCDKILKDGMDMATNEHTHHAEDLCSVCRSPVWDTGIVYEEDKWHYRDGAKVKSFLNEVEFEPNYIDGGSGGLSTVFGIVNMVMKDGIIKIEEN